MYKLIYNIGFFVLSVNIVFNLILAVPIDNSDVNDNNYKAFCTMYETSCRSEELATLIATLNDGDVSSLFLKRSGDKVMFLGSEFCKVGDCYDLTFRLFNIIKGSSPFPGIDRNCNQEEATNWYGCVNLYLTLKPYIKGIMGDIKSQHILITGIKKDIDQIGRLLTTLKQTNIETDEDRLNKVLTTLNITSVELLSLLQMTPVLEKNQRDIEDKVNNLELTKEVLSGLKINFDLLNTTVSRFNRNFYKYKVNLNDVVSNIQSRERSTNKTLQSQIVELNSQKTEFEKINIKLSELTDKLKSHDLSIKMMVSRLDGDIKNNKSLARLPIVAKKDGIELNDLDGIDEELQSSNKQIISISELHNPNIGENILGVYYLGRTATYTLVFSFVEKYNSYIVDNSEDFECNQEKNGLIVNVDCRVKQGASPEFKFLDANEPDQKIIFSFTKHYFVRLCPNKGSIFSYGTIETNDCKHSYDLYHQNCLLSNGKIKTKQFKANENCCYFKFTLRKHLCSVSELDLSITSCTYDSDLKNGKLKVILSNPDFISYFSKSEGIVNMYCNNACEINIVDKIDLVCPNGVLLPIQRNRDLSKKCPFSKTISLKTFSVLVCKATYHPTLFWFLLGWLIFGKMIVNLVLIVTLSFIKLILYISLRWKKMQTPLIKECRYCKTTNIDELDSGDHKKCVEGICPFCKVTSSLLSSHVQKCDDRVIYKINSLNKQLSIRLKESSSYKKIKVMNRSTRVKFGFWALTVLFLFTILFTPAFGDVVRIEPRNPGSVIDSFEMSLVKCGYNCWRTPDSCTCPINTMRRKRKSGSFMISDEQIKDIDHWGVIHLDSSYTPATFENNQEIILQQSNAMGSVTGNAVGYLKLIPESALSWNVRDQDSTFGETFSAFIYDVEHEYEFELDYMTVDRSVRLTPIIRCTGDCVGICKEFPSSRTLCQTWNKDRGWGCNPLSCWSINTGCTACSLELVAINPKLLMATWKSKLKSINYILCINKSHPGMNCRKVESSSKLNLDGLEIITSEAFGDIDKLPNRIMTITKLDDLRRIELVENILDATDMCRFKRCQFNQVGDWQTRDINAIFNTSVHETVWTSLVGVNLKRTCSAGSNPECVLDQRESFKFNLDVLLNSSSKITENFKIKYVAHQTIDNKLSLKLKVLPKTQYGNIQIHLKFNNYNLLGLNSGLKVSSCQIQDCSGCFNCHTGAFCNLKLIVDSPEKSIIQIYSYDHILILASTTYEVVSGENDVEFGLHTPLQEANYTICIKGTGTCCSKIIKLKEPDNKLFHSGKIIYSSSNDTPTWQINDVISTIQKSGNGFLNLIDYSLKSTLKHGFILISSLISLMFIYYTRGIYISIFKYIKRIIAQSINGSVPDDKSAFRKKGSSYKILEKLK
nr:MAG: glycoprotein [Sanya peribunyavirus 1]UHM27508.1 MAG: glycoprotein [Hangzhou paederus fuscipes nairovirus 1]